MSDALFRAKDLSVRIGGRTIVDHVSFELGKGEFVALVGPNGAGKTTLMRAMSGIETASGAILLGGAALAELSLRQRARHIAYLPQGHAFHWPMPVESVVALGRLPYADFFTRAAKGDASAVAKAVADTGIAPLLQRAVTTLSGGEQARVALARVLATQAPVILADEPTVSLDPRHQLVVMNLLRQAARDGAAVLAVVHDLTLAARFCGRVLMMERGRIVADGTPDQVLVPERLASVFGVDAVTIDTGEGRVPIVRHPL
jgi:iron complex transport system ATP-binding protein